MFTKKEQPCQNNPEKLYTEKKAKLKPSGWAMFTKCSFDETENKFDYYRGIDSIKKCCEEIRNHATEIINYEKHEMIPLTDEEIKFFEEQKNATYAKKSFVMMKIKKINLNYTKKLEIIVILQENLEELLIAFAI